jgi:drug/metabolite transporter (DMT)-like permease
VVLSAAGYGFIGIFGKRAFAAGLAPGEFLTLRFAIASAALWAFMLVARRRDLAVTRRQLAACAALGVFGYALFTTLYFHALRGLSASLTSLILYTFPVIVTVAAWALFKEPIGWRRALALPVVGVGLLLLLSGDIAVTSWGAVGLALASALFYSAYILASSRLLRGLDSLVAGLYIMTAAAVALAVVGCPTPAEVAALDASAWGSVLGIATVSTLGPLVLFLRGLSKLSNAEASILSLVEPLTTVVAASVLLGERLSPLQFAGGALVLGALVLSSLRSR